MSARRLAVVGGLVALGVVGAAVWWRRHPSACPYGQRFWVEAPHPFITRARLRDALEPAPGERLLEVGPGTGYYALDIASSLGPDGRLDLADIQPEFLAHVARRADDAGLRNVVGHEADATALPFESDSFDGAYLCAVL